MSEIDTDIDPGLSLAKDALRRRMRSLRRTLDIDRAAAARAAAAFLPGWGGLVVGGYEPMGGEFDPGPILAAAQAAGAVVVLPAPHAPDAPLTFHAAGDVRAPSLRPAVILAPLLAFDARGGRLGQGGGHFDRTIAQMRQSPLVNSPSGGGQIWVVGVAFAAQEVAAVPMAAHDQRLDAILTERGYRQARKD